MSTMHLAQAIKDTVGVPIGIQVGTVTAVNSDGSLAVAVRGAAVNMFPLSAYPTPQVGDVTQIVAYGSTSFALGPVSTNSARQTSSRLIQTGFVPFTFTAVSSATVVTNFPVAMSSAPQAMSVNISSQAGVTVNWVARAIVQTSTGFTAFVFNPAGTTGTWSGQGVQYMAVW